MAQADEITRDIIVALLSNQRLSMNVNNPEEMGEVIGKIYTAVLGAVKGAQTKSTASKVTGV
jgi:hypothetical protein